MLRKNLVLSGCLALMTTMSYAASHTKVSNDVPVTLYGYVPSSQAWTEDLYNIYSFTAEPTARFTCVPDDLVEPVSADGGGCYHDGKYYAVQYAGFMGLVLADFCVYNTETWEMEQYLPVTQGSVGTDMDFDVTTGMIYGCFYSDEWDHCVFGYINPDNGLRTQICDLNRIYFGMAVNSKGEVYGLSEEGNLVRFDKQSGDITLIGNTGVTPEYLASACFDHRTDQLYWTVSSLDVQKTGLYVVDTTTAEAKKVSAFAYNEEVQGLYIPIPAAEPLAPAKASDLTLMFDGPSLAGAATFVAPAMSFDGTTQLTGALTYSIYTDGEEAATGSCQPGAEVRAIFGVKGEGEHVITVRTANSEGLSPALQLNQWFGYDAPLAVTDLKAVEGERNGDVVVSWTAPTGAVHGGYLDVANLSYRVTRQPDGVEIMTDQTMITDHAPTDKALTAYTYEILPIVLGRYVGEVSVSNPVAVGAALTLPYYQDFAEASSFDLYTVIDRHGDGKTWAHDATFEAARAEYDWTNPKNDWLITPAMQMGTEHVYVLTFDAFCRDGNRENLEVKMGQGKTHTAMTHDILPRSTELDGMERRHFFEVLLPEEAGDWSIGFHAVSPVDRWWLYVDDIRVEEGPLVGTPHRVTGLTATEGAEGALRATLSFTTPDVQVEGTALAELTRIDIYRNGRLIDQLAAPAIGQPLTYVDEQAEQGTNTYRIVPVNAVGEGLAAEVEVYVGVDIPLAPTDLCLRKVEGLPVLTWTAPTRGVRGKYVDPERVVYYVVRSDNKQVATQLRATTFTDTALPIPAGSQDFLTYAVYAQNVAGLDPEQYAMSNEVCFGEPYQPTFHESFAEVSLEQGPWTWDILKGDPYIQICATGEYPDCDAQDGDGGLVSFKPDESGDEAMLYSSNIELADAQTPRFSFWYYNNPGSYDRVTVSVRVDDDPEQVFEAVDVYMNRANVAAGWTEATADLAAYAGHRIQLLFHFVSSSGEYLHIDNLSVSDRFDHRLPAIDDLAAEVTADGVLLTWSEPDGGSFAQPLALVGFNIYRDGQLLNAEEPEVEEEYLDETAAGASHTYCVTTVYDLGESYFSNAVTLSAEGIAAIRRDDARTLRYNLMGQRVLTDEPITIDNGQLKMDN